MPTSLLQVRDVGGTRLLACSQGWLAGRLAGVRHTSCSTLNAEPWPASCTHAALPEEYIYK